MIKQEEPCEGRLSSTVPWEREGETPSRDPTIGNAWATSELPTDCKKLIMTKQNNYGIS